jgi:hypothetical protein
MREWPRLNPHRRRHVQRLRRAGISVFVGCIGLASVVYRFGAATQAPTLQEVLPATAATIERQRGILFGPAIADMMGWFDLLGQPAGHAALIVVAGVIGAAAFYQIAHAIEIEEG